MSTSIQPVEAGQLWQCPSRHRRCGFRVLRVLRVDRWGRVWLQELWKGGTTGPPFTTRKIGGTLPEPYQLASPNRQQRRRGPSNPAAAPQTKDSGQLSRQPKSSARKRQADDSTED